MAAFKLSRCRPAWVYLRSGLLLGRNSPVAYWVVIQTFLACLYYFITLEKSRRQFMSDESGVAKAK